MKENIPFDKFCYYIKLNSQICKSDIEAKEKNKKLQDMFNEMTTLYWEDFESCTKEEMERIPISYIYDWSHITANYDKQIDKQREIEKLYSRYDIKPLFGRNYLKRFLEEK